MKQNERLLVYAVTGFLALILVIAVLFGSDPANAANKKDNPSLGLNEMLKSGAVSDEAKKAEEAARKKAAEEKANAQPLIAKPVLASDLVERTFGKSRRDRFVRFVPVKSGDSFERLVKRWCGSVDNYLTEAQCLNEDVATLKIGSEVAVPWVDDEVLAAIIEAQAPKTLLQRGGLPTTGRAATGGNTAPGVPTANTSPVPSFLTPGSGLSGSSTNGSSSNGSSGNTGNATGLGVPASTAGTKPYKVKPGDSLWKIAAKRYGKRNADRMVKAIKELNPEVSDTLQINQVLNLPAGE